MHRRIVLIGAGHAHIEVLRQARRFAKAGATLTLIEPGAFWYSGAATGFLSGALPLKRVRTGLQAASRDYTRVTDRARAIHLADHRVELQGGQFIEFDVLSLNTGSCIADTDLVRAGALPAKPISNLAKARTRIESMSGMLRLAVVGAGATGVEIALSLAALQRRLDARVQVTLVGPAPLLSGWPVRAAVEAENALSSSGVEWLNVRAKSLSGTQLVCEQGQRIEADLVIAATGLEASLPDGLPEAPDGLPVGPDLASIHDARLFAVGDCAHLTHAPRPKLGVFGVRAAPVLLENLLHAAYGRSSRRTYQPQARWLSLLDLGDGRALARYGEWSGASRLALGLKQRIDHRFVDRYQQV